MKRLRLHLRYILAIPACILFILGMLLYAIGEGGAYLGGKVMDLANYMIEPSNEK